MYNKFLISKVIIDNLKHMSRMDYVRSLNSYICKTWSTGIFSMEIERKFCWQAWTYVSYQSGRYNKLKSVIYYPRPIKTKSKLLVRSFKKLSCFQFNEMFKFKVHLETSYNSELVNISISITLEQDKVKTWPNV